jgi:diguanylate cyclase (GGDEF)-like protein/PAS domain S-box-containing protein
VFVKDAKDLRFVRFNRTGEKLLGKSRDILIGQTAHDLYPAEQADRINERDREVLESHQVLDIEEEPIETPQGIRYMHTRKVGIYDDDDTPLYLIGISNDVTENRMVRKQLDHFATYDALTGLYNRRVLENRLADEFNRYKRYKEPFTVFMLDIDHFKQCNDTYGHIAGDNVLRALAETIESTIRNTDFAARYGGEEFTVVLPETSLEDSEILANRLLTQTFRIRVPTEDKGDIRIRISIGVASTASTTKEWKEVLEEADQALYAAKQAGRNCVKMSVNGKIL